MVQIDNLFNKLPKSVFDELPKVVESGIDNILRLSHFLGQVAHESGGFANKTELLSYSKDGLLKVFPKYFNEQTALQYARKSEKIANKVYANRMGNGDELSGDGWKYRGRGYIQLTGKDNYLKFSEVCNDVLENPDLVATKYPLYSACWFWNKKDLSKIADMGGAPENVAKITFIINGGKHGLNDRIERFNFYFDILK